MRGEVVHITNPIFGVTLMYMRPHSKGRYRQGNVCEHVWFVWVAASKSLLSVPLAASLAARRGFSKFLMESWLLSCQIGWLIHPFALYALWPRTQILVAGQPI